MDMNNDIIMGNWKQLTGAVQKQWGKLTNDQIAEVGGNTRKLAGLIQEQYGLARSEAEKQVRDWEKVNNKSS